MVFDASIYIFSILTRRVLEGEISYEMEIHGVLSFICLEVEMG